MTHGINSTTPIVILGDTLSIHGEYDTPGGTRWSWSGEVRVTIRPGGYCASFFREEIFVLHFGKGPVFRMLRSSTAHFVPNKLGVDRLLTYRYICRVEEHTDQRAHKCMEYFSASIENDSVIV